MTADGEVGRGDPGSSRAPREASRGLAVLRISFGMIWAANLLFILDPANGFFPTFSTTAASYADGSLGGAAFPIFVADHATPFALLIAAVTGYLTVAFLAGWTTRWACYLGAGFAIALLVSQFGSTFAIPGGTDVGPMPLYLAAYGALLIGHAERYYSMDAWLATRSRSIPLPSVTAGRGRPWAR